MKTNEYIIVAIDRLTNELTLLNIERRETAYLVLPLYVPTEGFCLGAPITLRTESANE